MALREGAERYERFGRYFLDDAGVPSSGALLLLGAMVLSALAAQESAITREGRYWVKTIQGSGAIAQPRCR